MGINGYILTCTRQARRVHRGDRERIVRRLAGAETRGAAIARAAMAAPRVGRDVLRLLLALQAVEAALRTEDLAAGAADEPEDAEWPAC